MQRKQTKAQQQANRLYAQAQADSSARVHKAAGLLQQAVDAHAQLTQSSTQADYVQAYAYAFACTQQLCSLGCALLQQAHALGYSTDSVQFAGMRAADKLHAKQA